MTVESMAEQVRVRRCAIFSLKGFLCITCNSGAGFRFGFIFACMKSGGGIYGGVRKHIKDFKRGVQEAC